MSIAEIDFCRIGADWLNARDADEAFAKNQLLLPWTMAFDFSAGAFDPQQLGWDFISYPVVETDFEDTTLIRNFKFAGPDITHD